MIYANKVFIRFNFFSRSVVIMSQPTAKNAKLRNYRENHIMLSFVSVSSEAMCLECGAILIDDSMMEVKLDHH